jgi:hypothetical protein
MNLLNIIVDMPSHVHVTPSTVLIERKKPGSWTLCSIINDQLNLSGLVFSVKELDDFTLFEVDQ